MTQLDSSILAGLLGGPPLRVVFDLNEICNLRCAYCHIDALFAPHHKNFRQMPVDTFAEVVHDVEEMEVFELTLTGGEVTLISNMREYIQHLSQLQFTASQIITNGTVLSHHNIGQYVDAGLSRLSISLDGFAAQNDQLRGHGTFDRALRGLRVAVGAGLSVNVISVLHRRNYSSWFEFSKFLKEEGVVSHNLSLICRLGRAEEMPVWPGLNERQIQWLMDNYARRSSQLNVKGYSVDLNVGALDPGYWDGTPMPVHQLQDVIPGTEAVIKINGDVHTNRLVGKYSAIGNIYRTRLRDIWHDSYKRRLSTVEAIIANPSSSARNYYYLSPRRSRYTSIIGPNAVPHPRAERARKLVTGDQILFRQSDFTAHLRKAHK